MSFFDMINPFKKKEEFAFPPIDEHQGQMSGPQGYDPQAFEHQGYDQQMPSPMANPIANPMGQHSEPLSDHRMTMPLGENLRSAQMSAMYGNETQPGIYSQPEQQQYGHQGTGYGHEAHQASYPQSRDNSLQKELELISSKLDYLKASLDAVNQRLVNLEHMSRQQTETRRWQ